MCGFSSSGLSWVGRFLFSLIACLLIVWDIIVYLFLGLLGM